MTFRHWLQDGQWIVQSCPQDSKKWGRKWIRHGRFHFDDPLDAADSARALAREQWVATPQTLSRMVDSGRASWFLYVDDNFDQIRMSGGEGGAIPDSANPPAALQIGNKENMEWAYLIGKTDLETGVTFSVLAVEISEEDDAETVIYGG